MLIKIGASTGIQPHIHSIFSRGTFLLVMLLVVTSCDKNEGGTANEQDKIEAALPPEEFRCSGYLPAEGGCDVIDQGVHHDCHFNALFTRSGEGWTGGDATYSVKMRDGRICWFFGDSFIGNGQPRANSPLIRNSLVVQDGEQLTTYHSGTANNPSAYIEHSDPDDWYWPLDATAYSNKIHLMLAHMESTGNGMWDFRYASMDLAIISEDDFSVDTIITKHFDGDISYGSALMETPQYTYIYGISKVGLIKYVHLARVVTGNLSIPWEYYGESGWQSFPSLHRIHEGVSDQFSVIWEAGKYWLISQEGFLGPKINIWESNTPWGPFVNKRRLYCTPETEGDIFTYNAFVHTEFTNDEALMISYNVNSQNFFDIIRDPHIYRPRFVRVTDWQ